MILEETQRLVAAPYRFTCAHEEQKLTGAEFGVAFIESHLQRPGMAGTRGVEKAGHQQTVEGNPERTTDSAQLAR